MSDELSLPLYTYECVQQIMVPPVTKLLAIQSIDGKVVKHIMIF